MFHGVAITGDWSKPIMLRSLDDFKNQFGAYSPEGSITYKYVAGLLSSGLPVIFQRIACKNQASVRWVKGIPVIPEKDPDDPEKDYPRAKCASYTYGHSAGADVGTQSDIEISEKWGGTYGNNMTVNIKQSNNTYWLNIKYRGALLEKAKIITFKGSESTIEKNMQFIDALNNLKLDRVIINVKCPINEETKQYEYDKFQIPSSEDDMTLSGGTDFNEDLVKGELVNIYNTISDKILYLPKFITSGGYTDSSEESTIGTKMKELTQLRQDCRALIDLPLGTTLEEYQTEASKYEYTQFNSTSIIPSASIAGPWMYMQIGNEQEWMPPSFVYLTVVGNEVSQGKKSYEPKAGTISGRVYNVIEPEFEVGSDVASTWQADGRTQINPIMRLQSNEFIIAGNSTLLKGTENEINAFQESSVDLAVIEIRRFIYNLATELQYQYNNSTAFEKFSLKTANYFEGMIKQGALSDYEIINISTDDDPRTLKIRINVLVTPSIKAIEIYLNVAYGSVELNAGGEI